MARPLRIEFPGMEKLFLKTGELLMKSGRENANHQEYRLDPLFFPLGV